MDDALHHEVRSLRAEGYEVAWRAPAEGDDLAYGNRGAIASMADRLIMGQARFRVLESERTTFAQRSAASWGRRLAGTPLAVIGRPLLTTRARVQMIRERIRCELLYTPDKLAWHHQAGQATALLSIQYAHDLRSEASPGLYPTMSGPLGAGVLDLVFDERSSAPLRGRSLVDAAATARQEFSGRTADRSVATATRRVAALAEFVHEPVSEDFKQVVQYCVDALGIRSRKRVISARVTEHFRNQREHSDRAQSLTLLSVGCGTAVPVFEVAAALRAEGASVHIILIDQDPLALAAAQTLAAQEAFGLSECIEMHCRRLFSPAGIPVDLEPVIRGRRIDLVEDAGLREYLPKQAYRSLTRSLWAALSPGGLMSSGNMLACRPQPDFLHGLMGWRPDVLMRTIRAGLTLHEEAGVPRGATSVHVTPEGLYALFLSAKT